MPIEIDLLISIKDEINLLSTLTKLQQKEILPKFEYLIHSIPLDNLEYFDRIKILLDLLNICKEYESDSDIINIILIRWCNEDIDIDGILGDLASNMDCKDEILEYLFSIYPYSVPLSILDNHIRTRCGEGMIFSFTAERLLKCYGNFKGIKDYNLDTHQWNILKESAEETNGCKFEDINEITQFISRQKNPLTYNNRDIFEYISSKLNNKDKRIAKKPKYINLLEHENESYFETYFKTSESKIDKDEDEDIDNIKNTINNLLNPEKLKDLEEGDEAPLLKDEIIDTFISLKDNFGIDLNLGSDKELSSKINKDKITNYFRYFGPSNAIHGINCASIVKVGDTEIEGPCRLFTCICKEIPGDNEFEDNFEIDTDYYSWFTGKCDLCDVKIKKLRYAVRFPCENGGWIGCFCSFICMKKSEIRPIYESDEFKIEEIKNLINQYGITDL